jgi:hypothetical protein
VRERLLAEQAETDVEALQPVTATGDPLKLKVHHLELTI